MSHYKFSDLYKNSMENDYELQEDQGREDELSSQEDEKSYEHHSDKNSDADDEYDRTYAYRQHLMDEEDVDYQDPDDYLYEHAWNERQLNQIIQESKCTIVMYTQAVDNGDAQDLSSRYYRYFMDAARDNKDNKDVAFVRTFLPRECATIAHPDVIEFHKDGVYQTTMVDYDVTVENAHVVKERIEEAIAIMSTM